MAYTYVKSEFKNAISNTFVPSSWDNRHILTLTGGKQFKNNWELGIKFRYFNGSPYTPYDVNSSANKAVWEITQRGVLDYTQINTQRLPSSHQMDIRIDKKYYIQKTVLNIYLDVQNVYANKTLLQPFLTVVNDANGNPTEDPNNPSNYLLKELPNFAGTVLPTLGLLFEF